MTKLRRWWGLALLGGIVVLAPGAGSQTRTWSDTSGKFSIEAELVEIKAGKAVLKKADGSEVQVPLARLSQADRDFIQQQQAEARPDATAASKKEASPEQSDILLAKATEFFEALRTEERTAAAELLTAKAKEVFSAGQSAIKGLPKPDEAKKAIRPGKAKVDGSTAEVAVKVTAGGKSASTRLHFRLEDEEWKVFAISATFPDGDKTINLESPGGTAERVDPLPALVGQELDLSGITINGRPFDLSEYRGKVVLVNFWATWCPTCVAEMPNVRANWDKYHDAGFEVVAVSVDKDLNKLKEFVDRESPPWTILADRHPKNRKSAGDKFGIRTIPAFILIAPDGKVVKVRCHGPALGRELEKLLGDKLASAR